MIFNSKETYLAAAIAIITNMKYHGESKLKLNGHKTHHCLILSKLNQNK